MLRKVRIQVAEGGKTARLFDAASGEEIQGVTSYRLEHSAGRPALVHISIVRQVASLEMPAEGLDVASTQRGG